MARRQGGDDRVEVHDRAVDRAESGGRVAVALPGVDRRQVAFMGYWRRGVAMAS